LWQEIFFIYAGVISPFSPPHHTHAEPPSPPTHHQHQHHLHVPWPPPPIAPLIPIRLLWRGCLTHRHPSPYDPTPSFHSRRHSASRNHSPSALRARGSTAAAFDNCGVVPLVTHPPRGPPSASQAPNMLCGDNDEVRTGLVCVSICKYTLTLSFDIVCILLYYVQMVKPQMRGNQMGVCVGGWFWRW
jgi:hypothetical protein